MNAFAILYGVPVWGFALLWIALATALTVRTLVRGMPFASAEAISASISSWRALMLDTAIGPDAPLNYVPAAAAALP